MSLVSKFIDNTANLLKKPLGKALMFGTMLTAPLLADGQSRYSQDRDDKLWTIGLGTVITPGSGDKGETEVNFGFQATVPGFTNNDWFFGGARLTGKSFGGSVSYEDFNGQSGFYGWSQKFNTAFVGNMIGHRQKFGKASSIMIAEKNTINSFVGGSQNYINFSHFSAGIAARVDLVLPIDNEGHGFGLAIEAEQPFYRYENKSIVNEFSKNFGSYKQANPKSLINIHATYKF